MSFITAERIHDGHRWLPEATVIEINEEGSVVALHDSPNENTIVYEGVLTPGFINAHCHLELSHMRGSIPKKTGLVGFLKSVIKGRGTTDEEQKRMARYDAHQELLANGVVAVGDIANTIETLDLRSKNQLHIHTFVEALGFSEINAARSFGHALSIYHAFESQRSGGVQLRQSITPHAPYSVSQSLFRLIDEHAQGQVISIHNQESEEENKYYRDKNGSMRELYEVLNIDDSFFAPTGQSSLRSYLEWVSPGRPVIFVHNTYTQREDVRQAHTHLRKAHWCLCPNANLYIENRLPDIEMLIDENANICIGTDSLASNDELSVLAELATIKEYFPALSWETLLSWGTYKGAVALDMQEILGSIAPGKTPGIVNIANLDNGDRKASIKRIV
jgi:cytosine/adenosine deaminase-related metal-dependent hydrolase